MLWRYALCLLALQCASVLARPKETLVREENSMAAMAVDALGQANQVKDAEGAKEAYAQMHEMKHKKKGVPSLAKLKKQFANFDLNNDKTLTYQDLKYILGSMTKKMGAGMDGNDEMNSFQERITKDFISSMDQDGDGIVGFTDYAHFTTQMKVNPQFKKKQEERQNRLMVDILSDEIPGLKEKIQEAQAKEKTE